MEKDIILNCDQCHKRRAKYYFCLPDNEQALNLCKDCATLNPIAVDFKFCKQLTKAVGNSKCQYCGNPAVGGVHSMMPFQVPYQRFWCEQCRLDLIEFSKKPENRPERLKTSSHTDPVAIEELSHRLSEKKRRLKMYMRRKVRERK